MILERSSSVMRGARPAPERSPRPSIPSALKRWTRMRTVLGWHPSSSAILVVRSPCQLSEMIRALVIQSPGAWRLPASLRIFRSSPGSSGVRARSSFGMVFSFPGRRFGHALIYTAFEKRSTSAPFLKGGTQTCASGASAVWVDGLIPRDWLSGLAAE